MLTVAQSSVRVLRMDAGDPLPVVPKFLFLHRSKLLISGSEVGSFQKELVCNLSG